MLLVSISPPICSCDGLHVLAALCLCEVCRPWCGPGRARRAQPRSACSRVSKSKSSIGVTLGRLALGRGAERETARRFAPLSQSACFRTHHVLNYWTIQQRHDARTNNGSLAARVGPCRPVRAGPPRPACLLVTMYGLYMLLLYTGRDPTTATGTRRGAAPRRRGLGPRDSARLGGGGGAGSAPGRTCNTLLRRRRTRARRDSTAELRVPTFQCASQ